MHPLSGRHLEASAGNRNHHGDKGHGFSMVWSKGGRMPCPDGSRDSRTKLDLGDRGRSRMAPIVGAILDLPLSPRSSFVLESREPSGHGMRPPFDQTIENPWPLSPWWFRLPAEASRCLPDNGCILVRPPSAPASTNLHKVLSPEETDSVSRLKDSSLRFL